MRGGAFALAAQLLFVLSLAPALPAQQPVRIRDAGFAAVEYDNGLTLGAFSVYESVTSFRGRGSLDANWLWSLFSDGRWSMQGALQSARASEAFRVPGVLTPIFGTVRGETSFQTSTTAQQGFMPTLQFLGTTRLRFDGTDRQLIVGASAARTFDGNGWRTTLLSDISGWVRRGEIYAMGRIVPMHLQYGDVLADWEGTLAFPWGPSHIDVTGGVRTGEALRGDVAWGTVNVTRPLWSDLTATFSAGTYPVDLLQGLPGGRFIAVNLRLPNGRFPAPPFLRRRVLPPPAPLPPARPQLVTTAPLTLVMGEAFDSTGLREIRAWAPGVAVLEVVGDFTQWIPLPLVRERAGEFNGFYRIPPGAHRVNLRLDGSAMEVPVNLVKVLDDFGTATGMIVVR